MAEKILSEKEARDLANKIRGNLIDLDENLKYFHAVQGWLPLGYDSFTVWWDNEMRDLPIAVGIRNWAAYQMIRENTVGGRMSTGMTAVVAHATGFAPSTITGMKTRARPRVRELGKRDDELGSITILVPERWRRHLIALSNQKDRSMADLLRPVVKEGIMNQYGVDMDQPLYGKER